MNGGKSNDSKATVVRRTVSLEPLHCELLMGYESEVPDFARRLTVRHRHCVWWHILSGTVSVRTVDESVPDRAEAGAGATIFIAPGTLRVHRFSPDARLVSVHFSVEAADGRPLFPALPLILWPPGDAADAMVDAARRLVGRIGAGRGRAGDLRTRGELYLFAAALLRALESKGVAVDDGAAADLRLEAVLADLRRDPRAGPLPYVRWTQLTGLGRSQLDRLCRRHCGESLRARRDGILMSRLERQLAADSRDIKALAYDHGFVDASHLTRWFRSQSGATPGAFRRALAGRDFGE